jgi:hypothetical protein
MYRRQDRRASQRELFQPVLFEAEALRHPALPGDPAAEGDAVKIAREIVAPSVIDAGQVLGMTAAPQTDEVAAMRAAVQHRTDFAVMSAGDDDRSLSKKSRQIVARLRQFAGQGQKLPGRSAQPWRRLTN